VGSAAGAKAEADAARPARAAMRASIARKFLVSGIKQEFFEMRAILFWV